MSDYIVRVINLPGDIHAAVRMSEDDFQNIYINDQIVDPMARLNAYLHEKRHIKNNDFYNDRDIRDVEECGNENNG